MLFRNGTHTVDAVCYFAGAPPVWVMAAHEPALADYGIVYAGEGGKNPDLDPASTVIIEFANGVRGILNGAKMTPALHEIDLQGPEGRYVIDDEKVTAWRTERVEGEPIETDPPDARGYADFFGDNLVPAVDELARHGAGRRAEQLPRPPRQGHAWRYSLAPSSPRPATAPESPSPNPATDLRGRRGCRHGTMQCATVGASREERGPLLWSRWIIKVQAGVGP